ncbi:hypothetical protein M1M25_gp001 [Tenacibaculum phage Gundel_1]|uniref:Uncharacterized protein n=1 Tax=Tenacibaculum phage Gundel_1 TaxID=2745672 RepID=A0A8E5E9R0_9CAUD|nr:hypothetical protein M1M25_gp001 [Tenacibaculum phage Gundel_1]QQV91420.1 hypothetical protein Gundel1_1 [Tenacibaculum phage Gundel_1]
MRLNSSLDINAVTLLDKVKILLEQPYKLVLVQRNELERLRVSVKRSEQSAYINSLYKHYIIDKKNKTYLCN